MKRLAFLIALVAGCSHKPCAVTSECGNGEACVAAQCAALSCSDTLSLVDPATGICTPVLGCIDHGTIAGWASCADPCAGLGESACKTQPRCQATYTTDGMPVSCASGSNCPAAGTFRSCRALPQLVDPCKSLDASACQTDGRCELGPQPDCANGGPGTGGKSPPACGSFPVCTLKSCTELSGNECNARPNCTSNPAVILPEPVSSDSSGTSGTSGTGTTQPRSTPTATACFSLGTCFGVDERDCLMQHACRPIYLGAGQFSSCVEQDFTRHCAAATDCGPGERCNINGVCVSEGCSAETEAECNADLHCDPIYSLQCSPYANGGGGGIVDGSCDGGMTGGGGQPLPAKLPGPTMACGCEPSFSGCQPATSGCDPGKSVLVRDPALLDDSFWSLPRVLGLATGADANVVADGWLSQLGTSATVGGKSAPARTGAAQFLAALPRRQDGLLDAAQLGFVPTSLSNRLDLADASSCGEARVTYALAAGVSDRRHRMTVIIEMRQPYDGAQCRAIARSWMGLSNLEGSALQAALQAIYTPLMTPANLKQVRTNEFLVGPQQGGAVPAAWELREFHLGSDARLHQVLLPLQVDPVAVAAAPDFLTWAQANSDGLGRGTVTFPSQYQVPNGSEDGSRVTLGDPIVSDLVNHSTCAGCHTTATNSAFAHVAERFHGSGRAAISQFLEGEVQKRARHLGMVASGAANAVLDIRPMH